MRKAETLLPAISIGLIAATIFLFGLAVRLVPLLPATDAGHEAAH